MKKSFGKLIGAVILFAAAHAAVGQTDGVPSGPIRIVVPVSAGGTVDIVSRTVAAGLQKSLGQSVIVENRTGGSGVPATLNVINARPDGTALYMGTIGTVAVNPHLMRKPPYDPMRDLVPISLVADVPGVLVVAASSPFNSVNDLIDYAKKNPGKLNYGSSGNGTSSHMSAELFKQDAGLDIVHVPYPGATQAVLDLMGGQVQLFFDNIITALPQIKAGKLKPLAVTASKRSHYMPEVPTISESGVPGYNVTGWLGLMAPVGTPDAVIRRLSTEVQQMVRTPAMKAQIVGAETIGSTPEEFAVYLKAENERWAGVVKASNIPLN
ncbi:Bug family tripartite tricarboxylate transporter substrate binding protein [Variovorax ginsengisoli]|uniref:Tripartite tricarboxylate transporter substrate binding protein n=1 Tax=Variovorax ginsengisoli TaxID=363844 RepID=A0ABT8SEP3_9BURK|nr:tripartite tricarboxylate transporter substrate binding protein [Variovorax ginsengisoli]MDN8618204.1 tripartite tricarboxylate transporter substrate binding protein [Variovorax ginsengisoli]MDO1537374.1 tripartite tricarboxylate transporter substrate binding protein [Variovorax ginsengisoli]